MAESMLIIERGLGGWLWDDAGRCEQERGDVKMSDNMLCCYILLIIAALWARYDDAFLLL